jgi:hypothetical protein
MLVLIDGKMRKSLVKTAYGYPWWGRGDSNPHALRHMILSHARLPIPTLPREAELAIDTTTEKVNQKVNF